MPCARARSREFQNAKAWSIMNGFDFLSLKLKNKTTLSSMLTFSEKILFLQNRVLNLHFLGIAHHSLCERVFKMLRLRQ